MPSRFRSSSGATLLVAMLAVPAEKAATWRGSSNAGSGLPWWTPIAVTGLLFLASALYRFTHRPKPPEDITQAFEADEMTPTKHPPDTDRANFWRLLTD
jgi:hypothetical protein